MRGDDDGGGVRIFPAGGWVVCAPAETAIRRVIAATKLKRAVIGAPVCNRQLICKNVGTNVCSYRTSVPSRGIAYALEEDHLPRRRARLRRRGEIRFEQKRPVRRLRRAWHDRRRPRTGD